MNILLEIWNPFCAWLQKETFPLLRGPKKCDVIWRWHNKLFLLKNPKNLYFAWLHGQLVEQGPLNHEEIWYWVPWNVLSCNWYKMWRSKIFEWPCQKCSSLVLCLSSRTPIISITTKTCTDVEHYVICVNVTTNVCNDLY